MVKNSQRLELLDVAKAICIILVVVGHYSPDDAPAWNVMLRHWIYGFHMPLFLFVSGFIATRFSHIGESYGMQVLRKFKRLFVPYLVASTLIISLKILAHGSLSVDHPVDAFSYLRMFWQPEAGYFLWFEWTLLTIFLFFPLSTSPMSRGVVAIVSLIIHYVFTLGIGPSVLSQFFCLGETCQMAVWFMIGAVVGDTRWNITFSPLGRCLVLLVFLLCSVWFCFDPGLNDETMPTVFLPYIGILAMLVLSERIDHNAPDRCRSWLTALGRASYFIYLFHTTFMGLAKSLLAKVAFGDETNELIFCFKACLVIVIGIVVPLVIHRVLIRWFPSIKAYI